MVIFLNFQTTSNQLHPLEVENCDSNSRLVVDEDDNGKFRPERVKQKTASIPVTVGFKLTDTSVAMSGTCDRNIKAGHPFTRDLRACAWSVSVCPKKVYTRELYLVPSICTYPCVIRARFESPKERCLRTRTRTQMNGLLKMTTCKWMACRTIWRLFLVSFAFVQVIVIAIVSLCHFYFMSLSYRLLLAECF